MESDEKVAKAARFEGRLTPEEKALFERAARVAGRSVTDFVFSSAADAARRVLLRERLLELGAEDSRAFAEAIAAAEEPNERLREAMRRRRRPLPA